MEPAALWECEQVVHRFAWYLDQGLPAQEIASLFTPDGIWELPAAGLHAEGHDGLVRYFGAFSDRVVSRRVCSNVILTAHGPDEVHGTSYFTTFRIDGVPHGSGTLPVPPVTQVGVYTDVFRRRAGRWLIAHRRTEATFAAAMPVHEPGTV